MRHRAIWMAVMVAALTAPGHADRFAWNADGLVDGDWWVTFGAVSSAAAGAATVVQSVTATEALEIPVDADYAAVTIRSGTDVPVLAHAGSIAGVIGGATIAVGLFATEAEAEYYLANHVALGDPPQVYMPIYNGSAVEYKIMNDSAQLANRYGVYVTPVGRMRALALRAQVTDAATITMGITVRVRFGRY